MKIQKVAGICLAALTICLICSDFAMAQRGRGGGMMRMMGQNNEYALLMDARVQDELVLTEDQKDELKEIQEEAMNMMRDMFAEMQDMPREDRAQAFQDIRTKMEEKMEPIQGRVKEVLLPHQKDRLTQLGFQSEGRNRGFGGTLLSDKMQEELDITSSQREELEEAIEKSEKEIQEEIRELYKKHETKVLKVLDSGQRKKYREMVGDPFSFEDRNRRRGTRERGTDRNRR